MHIVGSRQAINMKGVTIERGWDVRIQEVPINNDITVGGEQLWG